jgi:hypothetical protein
MFTGLLAIMLVNTGQVPNRLKRINKVINKVNNLNNQKGNNGNNNGKNKKKPAVVNQEKPFATSLSSDLFISRAQGNIIPFEPVEPQSFSFTDLLKDIQLFFINLINRLWWGPSYIKIKRNNKNTPKPVMKTTAKNTLNLNLSNQ